MAWHLPRLSFSQLDLPDIADPMAFDSLQKPIVIQSHRTYHVRPAAEGDDANAIIRPTLDELSRYFTDRIKPRCLFAADRKIFYQHRPGDIEHEHDVDAAGFDLSKTFTKLRPRQRDDEKR